MNSHAPFNFNPLDPPRSLRLQLIGCEIFHRELCAASSRSPHILDLRFLPKALHDLPTEKMRRRLQEEILDHADPRRHAAVLLAYGLCNNGIAELRHPTLPLIIPRSHDCIALLLGSRQAYDTVFAQCPGAYYKTAGWIERGQTDLLDDDPNAIPATPDSPQTALVVFERYVAKYGEENARYLMETLGLRNYSRMAFIRQPGLAPHPYDEETKTLARESGLEYKEFQGDLDWLRRLTDGPWTPDDFLVLSPGRRIAPSYDETIIKAENPE